MPAPPPGATPYTHSADGTDSALEWEAFGASGVGDSGNTGVGDAETTIRMFCRAQKGRHVVF